MLPDSGYRILDPEFGKIKRLRGPIFSMNKLIFNNFTHLNNEKWYDECNSNSKVYIFFYNISKLLVSNVLPREIADPHFHTAFDPSVEPILKKFQIGQRHLLLDAILAH